MSTNAFWSSLTENFEIFENPNNQRNRKNGRKSGDDMWCKVVIKLFSNGTEMDNVINAHNWHSYYGLPLLPHCLKNWPLISNQKFEYPSHSRA